MNSFTFTVGKSRMLVPEPERSTKTRTSQPNRMMAVQALQSTEASKPFDIAANSPVMIAITE